jgi:hypothetical protein
VDVVIVMTVRVAICGYNNFEFHGVHNNLEF